MEIDIMNRRPYAFRKLKALHLFLFLGLLLLVIASFLWTVFRPAEPVITESAGRTLQIVAVFISLLALFLGMRLFKSCILQARLAKVASHKVEQYRNACLLWWGMQVFAGVLAAAGFLLTGNLAFIVLAFFHVVVIGLFMPRAANIIVLLGLSESDLQQLGDGEG